MLGAGVSAITSISLDHTQILGDSVEAIAREKADIVAGGVRVHPEQVGPIAPESPYASFHSERRIDSFPVPVQLREAGPFDHQQGVGQAVGHVGRRRPRVRPAESAEVQQPVLAGRNAVEQGVIASYAERIPTHVRNFQ